MHKSVRWMAARMVHHNEPTIAYIEGVAKTYDRLMSLFTKRLLAQSQKVTGKSETYESKSCTLGLLVTTKFETAEQIDVRSSII